MPRGARARGRRGRRTVHLQSASRFTVCAPPLHPHCPPRSGLRGTFGPASRRTASSNRPVSGPRAAAAARRRGKVLWRADLRRGAGLRLCAQLPGKRRASEFLFSDPCHQTHVSPTDVYSRVSEGVTWTEEGGGGGFPPTSSKPESSRERRDGAVTRPPPSAVSASSARTWSRARLRTTTAAPGTPIGRRRGNHG
jgi:hypothetical protein